MTTKKTTDTKVQPQAVAFSGEYIYAVGRRKDATAQVRLYKCTANADGESIVNGKILTEYFSTERAQNICLAPLNVSNMGDTFLVSVIVRGGGTTGQVEAVRHGIARALVAHDEALRLVLKAEGFLRRDPRSVERKKPGLKKARRATQWRKR